MCPRYLAGVSAVLAATGTARAADPVWQPVDVSVVFQARELSVQINKCGYTTDNFRQQLIEMFDRELVLWNLRPAPAARAPAVPLLTVTLAETDNPVSSRQLQFELTLDVAGAGGSERSGRLVAFGPGEYAATLAREGGDLGEAAVFKIKNAYDNQWREFLGKLANSVPVAVGAVTAAGLKPGRVALPLPGEDRFRRIARSRFTVESAVPPGQNWAESVCQGVGTFWSNNNNKYLVIEHSPVPAQWPLRYRMIKLKELSTFPTLSTEYTD